MMQITYKGGREDFLDELVRTLLFEDVELLQSQLFRDEEYNEKVLKAYKVVLEYMTKSSDERLNVFKESCTDL